MDKRVKCAICGTDEIICQYYSKRDAYFFVCPCCGRYELSEEEHLDNKAQLDGLNSYFYYNGFKDKRELDAPIEYRYFTTKPKEYCDEYNEKADKETPYHGRPVHYDANIVNAWLPKSFSEKNDMILLKLKDISDYSGQTIRLSLEEMESLLFIRKKKSRLHNFTEEEITDQLNFMLDYLRTSGYIEVAISNGEIGNDSLVSITAKGYERIDELEKNNADGRTVLVAMSFAEGTEKLRESIREGISNAGYIATFIDEVEHNEFITPELLSYIRSSRFVVVDLTHQNNGAYFEEGYAMGLGKPVIQLCKKGVQLHFDIAQKNTIMWESEDDIPERLTNRIKATIE